MDENNFENKLFEKLIKVLIRKFDKKLNFLFREAKNFFVIIFFHPTLPLCLLLINIVYIFSNGLFIS